MPMRLSSAGKWLKTASVSGGLDPKEYPACFEEALGQYCDALDSQFLEEEALERIAEYLSKMVAEN